MKPEISIVLPAYNTEKFIGENVAASLKQRGLVEIPYEIIVVNDGSDDKTAAILHAWKQNVNKMHQLRIIERDNGGIAKAVNTGIEHARGKTIVLIDADDILAKDAVAKLHQKFISGDYILVTGQHAGFDSDTRKILFTTHKENFSIIGNQANREPLLKAFGIGHPKMIKRRDVEAIGGFDTQMRYACDYDFALKAIFPGEIRPWGLVDDVLYYYRVHNSTSVINRSSQINCAEYALDKALKRLGITGKAKFAGRDKIGFLSYNY